MLRLSTIIPIKNVREYIEESLSTVISQSLKDREVILIDDGSTDGSDEYAKSLADKYDWVRFIRTDERGPGGARNAGIGIAEGKYINFADADDIVPEHAYERMYQEAERSGADCVIGRAVRMYEETGAVRPSWLHEKVYSEYRHETNIREYPYLVYDTTLWNKMVRRDFWVENGIVFPEKTPYQDIPGTFRMHYSADKISMIDDVVYVWRIRGGDNRSLTQQKLRLDNLKARLSMIGLVDKFVRENVTEESVIEAKRIKWLDTDLKSFMSEIVGMDEEPALKAMDMLRGYLEDSDLKETLSVMPVIVHEQYKALMDGDLARLKKLRLFETDGLRYVPSKREDCDIIGIFPEDIIKGGSASLGTTIDHEHLTQGVTRIEIGSGGYKIYGYAFLCHQPAASRFENHLKAYIIRTNGECVAEVKVKRHGSRAAAKKGVDENGSSTCNYYGSGYTIYVGRKTLASLESGRYHIRLRWRAHGQERDTTVKGLSRKAIEELGKTLIKTEDGRKTEITAGLRKEPEITVS